MDYHFGLCIFSFFSSHLCKWKKQTKKNWTSLYFTSHHMTKVRCKNRGRCCRYPNLFQRMHLWSLLCNLKTDSIKDQIIKVFAIDGAVIQVAPGVIWEVYLYNVTDCHFLLEYLSSNNDYWAERVIVLCMRHGELMRDRSSYDLRVIVPHMLPTSDSTLNELWRVTWVIVPCMIHTSDRTLYESDE